MKKLYSLLLAIAALFITTNMNAALPAVGDSLYLASNNIIVEVTGFTNTSSLAELRLMVVGLNENTHFADTLRPKFKNAWKNATELAIPGVQESTSGSKTQRIVVEGVKYKAYYQHANLTTVSFGPGANENFVIQGLAFSECTALKSVNFSKRKKIELLGSSFAGCTSLTTVKFPTPDEGINLFASCFEGCTSLDLCTVNLNGVRQIWSHAFKNTATGSTPENNFLALNNVQKLGADILQGTRGSYLTDLQFELDGATLETSASKATESPFYSIRKQIQYIDMTGGSVTGLGDYLFWGMENTEIDGWGWARTYGKHCMENCKKLSEFSLYLDNAITIGDSAFVGIESPKVYLPAGVPGMGKNVFGAMSDGFTLFIINTTTCDDELAELYMMEDENENLWTPYKEGRLLQKGTRQSPVFESYKIENATAATSYSQSGYFRGVIQREPVCGQENFIYEFTPSARYYALDEANDTIQCFYLSHIEYNGNKYYPDNNHLATVPLASDATKKITPVFMPKLIKEVNVQVGLPQVGDPIDASTAEIILPEGALYSVKSATLFNSEGNYITGVETLQPNTEYHFRVILQPNFARAAFPWATTNKPDTEQVTTLINGTAADEARSWDDGTIGIIRYFTTSDTPHAIDNVESGENATKVLRNGQLIIIRDGKEYNAQGAQL
jgi:hypothetical protein